MGEQVPPPAVMETSASLTFAPLKLPSMASGIDMCLLLLLLLLPMLTVSVGVGRFDVCLFVCLSVCPEHNSKMNDPKCLNARDILEMVLGLVTGWGYS